MLLVADWFNIDFEAENILLILCVSCEQMICSQDRDPVMVVVLWDPLVMRDVEFYGRQFCDLNLKKNMKANTLAIRNTRRIECVYADTGTRVHCSCTQGRPTCLLVPIDFCIELSAVDVTILR